MTRFFIVRHGDTFAPGDRVLRIGARTDLPMTGYGIAQAHALAAFFVAQGIRFSTVMAGSLHRTIQTATIIADRTAGGRAIAMADVLLEIDHGPDEGQPESTVLERLGSEVLALWDDHAIAPPDWIVDARRRIEGWRNWLAHPPSGDTLLVTSNGAARFALLAALPDAIPSMKLRTGAFGVLNRCAKPESDSVRTRGWDLEQWDVRPPPF